MSVGKRLWSAFFFSILTSIIVSLFCFYQMKHLEAMTDELIGKVEGVGISAQSGAIGAICAQVISYAVISRDFERAEAEWTYDLKSIAGAQISMLQKIATTPSQQNLAGKTRSIYEEIVRLYEKELLPTLKSNNDITPQIKALVEKINNKAGDMSATALTLRNDIVSDTHQTQEQFAAAFRLTIFITLIMALIGIIISLVVSQRMARSIVNPLKEMTQVASHLASGNIHNEIKYVGKDEIGDLADSFRAMMVYVKDLSKKIGSLTAKDLTVVASTHTESDTLNLGIQQLIASFFEIITMIRESALQTYDAAEQMSDASQTLSSGAIQQASALEEISSSMQTMSAESELNAKNAKAASVMAQQTRSFAQNGIILLGTTVAAIRGIADSGDHIKKIIKVIDDIAFQTNLLALNAAVEAARAGAHGHGFAVVAEEVRNLSNRSATASREISQTIEVSSQKIEQGIDIASKTVTTFESMISEIDKASKLVNGIAICSTGQAEAIEQLSRSLDQVAKVTQQNSSSAEQTAEAARQMDHETKQMMALVAQFKLA